MKPFHQNHKLVIKLHVFAMHAPFPGVEFSDNDLMSCDISK